MLRCEEKQWSDSYTSEHTFSWGSGGSSNEGTGNRGDSVEKSMLYFDLAGFYMCL